MSLFPDELVPLLKIEVEGVVVAALEDELIVVDVPVLKLASDDVLELISDDVLEPTSVDVLELTRDDVLELTRDDVLDSSDAGLIQNWPV